MSWAFRASSRKAISCASSDTSATWAVIFAPCGMPSAVASAMVRSMFFWETSHMATLQPSAISWRASSRPMPVPPPVTTANLPAKSFMARPSLFVGNDPSAVGGLGKLSRRVSQGLNW